MNRANMFKRLRLKYGVSLLLCVVLSSSVNAADDCQSQATCSCSSTGEATGYCYTMLPDPRGEMVCTQTPCICTAFPKPLGGVQYMKSCGKQNFY